MNAPAYRPDIDGLRGLAILSVLLFHAFPEHFPGGFIGVDIFFVISGYLISRLIVGNLASGSFSFSEFYARRIKRIFPAHYLVLASVFALGWLLLAPEDSRQLSKHAVAGATFTSNFLLWREAGYFDAGAETKPFLHLWSLAIEEQFYLIWPLLAWLAWRFRISVVLLAVLIGGASFLWNIHSVGLDPEGTFYSPATRFWELMIGCALGSATGAAIHQMPAPARANALSVTGLLLIAAGWCLISKNSAFPGGWALLPTLGTALLIRGGANAWLNGTIFANGWMVKLGLIAFPLYLWHWPLLSYLHGANPDGIPLDLRLSAILLSLILAWFTYSAIERRIQLNRRKVHAAVLIGLASLMAVTAFAAFKTELSPKERLDAGLQAALSWPASNARDPHCNERLPAAAYCRLANPGIGATHLLIGDSQANQFFPGLAAEIARNGGNLLHLGAPGCVPLFGVDTGYTSNGRPCSEIIDKAYDLALKDRNLRTVILAANWHLYARGTRFSSFRNRFNPRLQLSAQGYPRDTDNAVLFAAAFAATIERLERSGKKVVVIRQVPELETRMGSCVAKLRALGAGAADDGICSVARPKVEQYAHAYTGLMEAGLAGRQAVTVLDPLDVLCSRDICHAVLNGNLLYRDDLHLGPLGSGHVAEKLWPRVAAGR
jgi:peptidoglycan/LPS O-acetylase OafA/YrhL